MSSTAVLTAPAHLRDRMATFDPRPFRSVKDDLEVTLMRAGARMVASAAGHALLDLKIGTDELTLSNEIQRRLWAAGWNGSWSFNPSCASGVRTAELWAGPTLRRLAEGDVVNVDIGVKIGQYNTDVARTVFIDGPMVSPDIRSEWDRAYTAVISAIDLFVQQAQPAMDIADIERNMGMRLQQAGFDRSLAAYMGHGVGLDKHEEPTIGPTGGRLQAGMVIAVEPSVILSSGQALRIEEMVLVTNGPAQFLSVPTQKDLSATGTVQPIQTASPTT